VIVLIGFIVVIIVLLLVLSKKASTPNQGQNQGYSKTEKQHKDAARYIRNSSDAFAKRQLEQVKNRPEAYSHHFCKHANDNHTLKVALGLLVGYLTWEHLNDSSQEENFHAAMERLDTDLENDVIPTESDYLESLEQQTNEALTDEDDKNLDDIGCSEDEDEYEDED